MPRGRSPCTQAPSAPSISELDPRCFQGRIASVVLSSSAVEGFQNLDSFCTAFRWRAAAWDGIRAAARAASGQQQSAAACVK